MSEAKLDGKTLPPMNINIPDMTAVNAWKELSGIVSAQQTWRWK
jgi:hypothetical protein